MRIISGKYKGHRLVSFQAKHIRPTTDRVKETLFNKLMGFTEGARVLDLFSGTGNLGLEALSRGATYSAFVEDHPKSLGILKENLNKLKVDEDFKIYPMDVFRFLKKYEEEPFQIVLADPPFTKKLADAVMLAVSTSCVVQPDTLVAIEASSHEPIQDAYRGLILLDRKNFGDKSLSLYQARSS